ncbi:MAG: 4-(cytidine 5'-diphospho)-2-C-methyl-D-erythritol kinase [Candidatus Gastranaerophilaceae bacterium]
MQVKVKTPAKINLTLEVTGKRPDGFHNIQSIMQMINLYDYLTITAEKSEKLEINLTGNNPNIPYNEKNIVYKAILLFVEEITLSSYKFEVDLQKNIPTEAGLAGGSSNAVGTFVGLNYLFDNPLSKSKLHNLCAKLGSDLNVILEGGCVLATGRGENVENLPFREYPVSLIKPNNLGISAKEGYQKYAQLENKPNNDNTHKMIELLQKGEDVRNFLYNDLETAVFSSFEQLQKIKKANPNSIMSGSGSTYFVLNEKINQVEDYWHVDGLKTIPTGCEII